MAEITRQRVGELLRQVFATLLAHPEWMQAREVLAAVRKAKPPTAYEDGEFPSGGTRYEKIVRFATVETVKAGWLLKTKGKWSITEAGRTAFEKYRDPEDFIRQASRLFSAWRKQQAQEEEDEPEVDDAQSSPSITFEKAEEQAWGEIEERLRSMPPFEFQDLVASLLKAMGYHVAWVAPPGKDGGVDVLAWSDPLGTRPPRIKVQVKRLGSNVDVNGLRSFMAQLGDDDVGIFVTTAGFTKDAQEEARTQEKRKVTLVDLERFFDLWVEHYDRLEEAARRQLPLKPIYFLAPES